MQCNGRARDCRLPKPMLQALHRPVGKSNAENSFHDAFKPNLIVIELVESTCQECDLCCHFKSLRVRPFAVVNLHFFSNRQVLLPAAY